MENYEGKPAVNRTGAGMLAVGYIYHIFLWLKLMPTRIRVEKLQNSTETTDHLKTESGNKT